MLIRVSAEEAQPMRERTLERDFVRVQVFAASLGVVLVYHYVLRVWPQQRTYSDGALCPQRAGKLIGREIVEERIGYRLVEGGFRDLVREIRIRHVQIDR